MRVLTFVRNFHALIRSCVSVDKSILYNTLLNSDRLIGCLWSRDIE